MKSKTSQVFLCNDLGGGDGGKGGVVHKLCCTTKVHTVIKVGGAQGSHGVRTSSGKIFNFSQIGCGTFEGVSTHISNRFLVEPIGLQAEINSLRYEHGVIDILNFVTIDSSALCITPFHAAASRLRELARKDTPKGTVGIGGGEALKDAETHPGMAIRAGDLKNMSLVREKLHAIRKKKREDVSNIINAIDSLWANDTEYAEEALFWLSDDAFFDLVVEKFYVLGRKVRVVDSGYVHEEIFSRNGKVVVESSHGILTDRYFGFHPHTTALRTLPQYTKEMLKECGYNGEVVQLGVSRAYQIRHGAGPMVTEVQGYFPNPLPDSNKQDNRWQGTAREGPLDLVALKYAIEVCGGPRTFNGLTITWFDQVIAAGKWDVCHRYEYDGAFNPDFFTARGVIKPSVGQGDIQLERQATLTQMLKNCKPVITTYELPNSREGVIDLCSRVLEENLKVPVRMISFGPTEKDKVCI